MVDEIISTCEKKRLGLTSVTFYWKKLIFSDKCNGLQPPGTCIKSILITINIIISFPPVFYMLAVQEFYVEGPVSSHGALMFGLFGFSIYLTTLSSALLF